MLDASLFGVANDQYNDIPVERMTVHSTHSLRLLQFEIGIYAFHNSSSLIAHQSLLTAQEYNVQECDQPARYFRFHDKRGFRLWPLEQH